jgi:ribosomal protein S18 acetylase RimI-like enzyme
MNRLVIRAAQENDLPGILEVYQSLEDGDNWSVDLATATKQFMKISSYPNYAVYIAERDGEIVGTFELLIMDNLAHTGKPSAIVEDVAVKMALHGSGIGKAMMLKAMEISRQCGCYKMMLSSNLKRERTHRFYKSLGFEIHGYSFYVEL